VAYDPSVPEWGVAVQSKFLAVGAIVPWAQAGAGVVATQARSNVSFGPQGLEMMAQGANAPQALDRLITSDEGREYRQVGLIDAHGTPAVFTGAHCQEWAGALMGVHYAVQGNFLVGSATLEAMAHAFERGAEALADRLVSALAAGQEAGGDRRGQQAAAVLVVREKGGYGNRNDRYVDLRVDDAPRPIEQLKALLDLHHLIFEAPRPDDWVKIEGEMGRELQRILRRAGHYSGSINGDYDEHTRHALQRLMGMENLDGRFREAEGLIDRQAVVLLSQRLRRG
jgi:uncharacterized Ntn-hydrolase superfamily protein